MEEARLLWTAEELIRYWREAKITKPTAKYLLKQIEPTYVIELKHSKTS